MSKKVLVIDDEEVVARSLMQLFKLRYTAEVDVANSVAEATIILKENQYEFLVVDYNLPDGTGYKMLCDLSDELPWLKDSVMVFISGISYVDMTPDFKASIEIFPRVYVRNKPINAMDLFELADQVLDKK